MRLCSPNAIALGSNDVVVVPTFNEKITRGTYKALRILEVLSRLKENAKSHRNTQPLGRFDDSVGSPHQSKYSNESFSKSMPSKRGFLTAILADGVVWLFESVPGDVSSQAPAVVKSMPSKPSLGAR